MKLILPFPPTENTYRRFANRGRFAGPILSKRARAYKQSVKSCIGDVATITGHVHVEIELHPPDRRRRDLDNYLKALFDAITEAGVWEDDSQVRDMRVRWADRVTGGKAVIEITEVN